MEKFKDRVDLKRADGPAVRIADVKPDKNGDLWVAFSDVLSLADSIRNDPVVRLEATGNNGGSFVEYYLLSHAQDIINTASDLTYKITSVEWGTNLEGWQSKF